MFVLQQQNYTKMAPRTVKRKTTPKTTDVPSVKKNKTITSDVARLIAQRLETPPNVPESDDELDVADKNSDENENNKQTATQKTITEPERTATQKTITEPERTKTCASTNVMSKHGEKVLMTMNREHSMFMNCIPLTRDMLGNDVLAKIRSVVRNSLFKSAKFYPNPSHANPVVGLCLYDCDFREPGIAGDNERMKRWETVRNEIIHQTGILRQQVVQKWYDVVRGTYK